MTYSESAKNVTITRRRAVQELAHHGMSRREIAAFFEALGVHEYYNAGDVLLWLGY